MRERHIFHDPDAVPEVWTIGGNEKAALCSQRAAEFSHLQRQPLTSDCRFGAYSAVAGDARRMAAARMRDGRRLKEAAALPGC